MVDDLSRDDSQRQRAELLRDLSDLSATLKPALNTATLLNIDPEQIPVLHDVIEDDDPLLFDDAEDANEDYQREDYQIADPQFEDSHLKGNHVENMDAEDEVTDFAPAFNEQEDFDREILVQQVIDDMMPAVEAELRRRLLKVDPQLLQCWSDEQLDQE